MAKKSTRPLDEDLIKTTTRLIELGVQYAEEDLDVHREKATRYFAGVTPDGLNDRPNRSKYVDNILQDTVLWMQPSLSRIFSAIEDVVEIRPRDPVHAIKARISMEWVNQVLTIHNSSFVEDQQMMQDAFLRRLGWQRFYWEDGAIRFQTLEPANVLTSRDAGADRLTWPFVAVKTQTSPAALRGEGYDVDDEINGGELGTQMPSQVSDTLVANSDDLSDIDLSLKEVWKYEIWWPDYEEKSWHYVCRCGDEVLKYEKVAEHELVYITPILVAHQLDGLSIADLAFTLQDVSTAVHRAVNDGFYRTSEPREEIVVGGIVEGATLDDLFYDRLNGRIRVRQQGTVVPIPPTPLPTMTQALLDHYDDRTSARTGVQRYQQGLAPDTLNKTATGTQLIMDAATMRLEQVARTFAETGFSQRVGLILRMSAREPALLAKHSVTIDGQMIPLHPDLLVDPRDVLVNVSVGVGNRMERATNMWNLLDRFDRLMANPQAGRLCPGGDLAVFTAENVHNALAEALKLSGYTDAYRYTVNPRNPVIPKDQPLPPPPPTPEDKYVELETQKLVIDLEKAQVDNERAAAEFELKRTREMAASREMLSKAQAEQTKAETERMRLEIERESGQMKQLLSEAELELREAERVFKVREHELRAREVAVKEKEAEIDGMQAASSATQAARANDIKAAEVALKYKELGAEMEGAELESPTGGKMSELLSGVQAIQKRLDEASAPRQVVRDELGRVAGVGNWRVERDADGRVIGVTHAGE